MSSVKPEAGNEPLAVLLTELGAESIIATLSIATDGIEHLAVKIVDDLYADEADTLIAEDVESWTLVSLDRGPNAVGALLEAVVRLSPEDEDDDDPTFSASALHARVTITQKDEVWIYDSSQFLPIDYQCPVAGAVDAHGSLCPLCAGDSTGRLYIGLPDPVAEQKAVAAGMIFAGDVIWPPMFGATRGCRTCGHMWTVPGDFDEE